MDLPDNKLRQPTITQNGRICQMFLLFSVPKPNLLISSQKLGSREVIAIPKKIFLFSGSEFDFFYFSERDCSTGESKKMYQ